MQLSNYKIFHGYCCQQSYSPYLDKHKCLKANKPSLIQQLRFYLSSLMRQCNLCKHPFSIHEVPRFSLAIYMLVCIMPRFSLAIYMLACISCPALNSVLNETWFFLLRIFFCKWMYIEFSTIKCTWLFCWWLFFEVTLKT